MTKQFQRLKTVLKRCKSRLSLHRQRPALYSERWHPNLGISSLPPAVASVETPGQKDSSQSSSGFLSLPGEVRNQIYEMLLLSEDCIFIEKLRKKGFPSSMQVNRLIREEASSFYFLENEFAMKRKHKNRLKHKCFLMEAFLTRTGASKYNKYLRVDWYLHNQPWYAIYWPSRWERLLEDACMEWVGMLSKSTSQAVMPFNISKRAFKFWATLIVAGEPWRRALSKVRFLQWVMDEQMDCIWTLGWVQVSDVPFRNFIDVRLASPSSTPTWLQQFEDKFPSRQHMPVLWEYHPKAPDRADE